MKSSHDNKSQSPSSTSLTALESAMVAGGWARDTNCYTRWYAGKLQPVFPLEIRVTDAIWIVTRPYGQLAAEPVMPLMRFETVESLEQYLTRNGVPAEAAPAYSNSWD